jgi:hypothetical protein
MKRAEPEGKPGNEMQVQVELQLEQSWSQTTGSFVLGPWLLD